MNENCSLRSNIPTAMFFWDTLYIQIFSLWNFDHSLTFPGFMQGPTHNLGPIGSAVWRLLDTNRHPDKQCIDWDMKKSTYCHMPLHKHLSWELGSTGQGRWCLFVGIFLESGGGVHHLPRQYYPLLEYSEKFLPEQTVWH